MSEDPIFKKKIVRAKVFPEVERHINAIPDAKEALATLVKAGCKRKRILLYLYWFIGGDPRDVQAVKRGFARCRTQVSALATHLENVADEIKQVEHNLRYTGLADVATGDLPEDMRSMANFLSRLNRTVIKDMASGRVSGREKNLVLLAYMVGEVTGRPHHREIGALADAVGMGYDPNFIQKYTAKAVEKLVKRHGWVKPPKKKQKPKAKGRRRSSTRRRRKK